MSVKKKKTSGGNPRTIPEGYAQVNFNIDVDYLAKVTALAHWEPSVTKSDIYNAAVEEYIKAFEKKNGVIKPIPKGNGLKL